MYVAASISYCSGFFLNFSPTEEYIGFTTWDKSRKHRQNTCTPDRKMHLKMPFAKWWYHFANDILKCIFSVWKCCILIEILLKCVLKGPVNSKSVLVHLMVWHQTAAKPLSGPVSAQLSGDTMLFIIFLQLNWLFGLQVALVSIFNLLLYSWVNEIFDSQTKGVHVMWLFILYQLINTLRLRQDGRHFPGAILKYIYIKFWLRFHWSMFLWAQLTIFQHWFR